MHVAIQGQNGSFHQLAVASYFGDDIDIMFCPKFYDVFEALTSGKTDYALIAIENSLYGSINEVYDLLIENKLWICAEVYIRVRQCLIGLKGSKLSDITEVHSQAPAIGQCRDYLDKTLPKAKYIEQPDTAYSAALVAKLADPTKAAIASKEAASLHGLCVLAENIETYEHNYTRFVVLQNTVSETQDANKTTLILTTTGDDKPGRLYRALGVFAELNINMTMLHSRPVISKVWHYQFFIDIDCATQDKRMRECVARLQEQGNIIRLLGSYKSSKSTDI